MRDDTRRAGEPGDRLAADVAGVEWQPAGSGRGSHGVDWPDRSRWAVPIALAAVLGVGAFVALALIWGDSGERPPG
ncbi:MAG TPA: hypothetical protein VMM60_12980, partial [Ilumatobacter sp.]|nr:hypothetical protein [Ilumatobacter sp.]